ncbi:MAG TPA: LysR substrate-binding domain-containing protein [Polyangia bacterium]|nr:LysR substrate-binding domain-containing protein [Polyangia bacterium]
MEIDQLRTFLMVLEQGGFSRAAEALKIGQSTVSFHVKALEAAAGARLLDRRSGRVRATASGRLLERYAVKLVALRDEALARLRAEESGERGRVRVAASTIPAELLLPPVLAAFRRAHPQVAIAVEVSDSRGALEALLAQECDLALVGAQRRDARVAYSAFAADEVVLAGAPRFAPSGKLTIAELSRVPLILREEGSGTGDAVSALLGRAATSDSSPAPLAVGSSEAARRCAVEGVGLTFISRRAIADDVAARRLHVIKLPGTPVHRRFSVARLRAVSPSAAARALSDELHRYYR